MVPLRPASRLVISRPISLQFSAQTRFSSRVPLSRERNLKIRLLQLCKLAVFQSLLGPVPNSHHPLTPYTPYTTSLPLSSLVQPLSTSSVEKNEVLFEFSLRSISEYSAGHFKYSPTTSHLLQRISIHNYSVDNFSRVNFSHFKKN